MRNIPNEAAEASIEATLDDLLTIPLNHRGLVVKMLIRYAETAAPFIAAQAWDEGQRARNHPTGSPNPYRTEVAK